MGIVDQIKNMQAGLADSILELDRPKAYVQYLTQLGLEANLEWTPDGLMDAHAGAGRCRIGRIRLANSPIDSIELLKVSGNTQGKHSNLKVRRTGQVIRYFDHFLVEAPNVTAPSDVLAVRKPKKAFMVVGRVVGHPWRGGRLAEQLEADAQLNQVLEDAGEEHIHVRHDAKAGVIMMVRPYSALTSESIMGLRVKDVTENVNVHVALPSIVTDMLRNKGEVERHFGFPTPLAIKAYTRIAHYARRLVGLANA